MRLNPKDPADTPYKLKRAIKDSSLTRQDICDRLEAGYGVKTSPSALSRTINRNTIILKLAVQVLAVCRVDGIGIEG